MAALRQHYPLDPKLLEHAQTSSVLPAFPIHKSKLKLPTVRQRFQLEPTSAKAQRQACLSTGPPLEAFWSSTHMTSGNLSDEPVTPVLPPAQRRGPRYDGTRSTQRTKNEYHRMMSPSRASCSTPKATHGQAHIHVPPGGPEGYKLERAILMRLLHVVDLGRSPRHSELLDMIKDNRIPESFHKLISKSVPGDCFEEVQAAVHAGKPLSKHMYQELMTDEKTSEVLALWEPSPYEVRSFTHGQGPMSDPAVAELTSLLPQLWAIRGRTLEERQKDSEYAKIISDLSAHAEQRLRVSS